MGELWHCTSEGRMVGMRGKLHTRLPVARESVMILAKEEVGRVAGKCTRPRASLMVREARLIPLYCHTCTPVAPLRARRMPSVPLLMSTKPPAVTAGKKNI
jgi:hypothetical protein